MPHILYLRALGLIYLTAFLSLSAQLEGLWGNRGVTPAAEFMRLVWERYGGWGVLYVPSLAWLSGSNASLELLCTSGIVLSTFLLVGFLPWISCLALWILYLSFVNVGGIFLQYQWESLLLETGFLSLFIAPRTRWLNGTSAPQRPWVLLHRWLLFRLMFSSGIAKLASGDPSWRNLTALSFHYETQPLPTWLSWFAHHLPVSVHKASCLTMFGAELILPFFFFLSRPFRRIAFWGQVGLQLVLALTGNYTYFNFLSLALCLTLLDPPEQKSATRTRWSAVAVCTLILFVSGVRSGYAGNARRWIDPVLQITDRLHLFSSYGLFAWMTIERNEIVIEGSADGTTWKEYGFPYKSGDLRRRPRFVAPYQPRLDWQAWFAALGEFETEHWLQNLLVRLLEGESVVLRLLADNPFPQSPPKLVRVRLYRYEFTRPGEIGWWRRTFLREYSPVLSLP